MNDNKIKIMGIGMIFKSMKKLFICVLAFTAVILCADSTAFSAPRKIPTVVVLSDTGHRNGTTYIICGAASDIIATDIINEMNKTGRIKAPLLGENMSRITQKTLPLYYMTFFNDYKFNYNIDFVNLKRVTKNIPADYVLMVTSGLDVQSQFLRETWWNKWGISSSEPIVPTYRLTTMLTLIDRKTSSIVWQDLYQRDIKAENSDLAVTQFSPSYAQLAKIKKYSRTMSEYVVNNIDKTVNPWILPPEEPKSVEMRSRFLNEGTKVYYPAVNGVVVKQNFNEFKTETQMKLETQKHKRMQKKQIDSVRKLEKQQNIQQIKYEKKKAAEQKKLNEKKKDERLFDSIRNNIDDVSNSLPAPQEPEEEMNIKPAVNIQPAEKKEEPKVIQPVMNKPSASKPADGTPAVKETKPEPNKEENHAPYYDWNLKNIYLEKIGKMSHLD